MPTLHCSFCSKPEHKVGKLIAAPAGKSVYICDQCVAVCASILQEEDNAAIQRGKQRRIPTCLVRSLRHLKPD